MTKRDDGGPAFPRPFSIDREPDMRDVRQAAQPGMSLRDYFAAQALPFALNQATSVCDTNGLLHSVAAGWAYQIADEMLKERAK